MNSPFPQRPVADFRPVPISASKDATEQEKLRVTRPPEYDFRPRPVVDGPKESAAPAAITPDVSVDPAHPAATKGKSLATGESTQLAEIATTPKSSSPNPPTIPSKPSGSA